MSEYASGSSGGQVTIGEHRVGDGNPVLFVAEIGTFFNQDTALALSYIDRLAAAGVPVVKTEIMHSADICLDGTGLEHEYRHAGGVAVEDYRSLIERKTLPLSEYERLFSACHERGLPIMASVYDVTGVDFVVANGGVALKIFRKNVNNVPLIRAAATSGLPVVFDMGQVRLEEIAFAVRIAREAGVRGLVVNLHPGVNPAPAGVHNLRTIDTLKAMCQAPVGFSCHYRGEELMYAAIGAGVNLIEKGVDSDPDRQEQDLVSAMSLDDVEAAVARVRACSKALGSAVPDVPVDRDLDARSGLVAARNLEVGRPLTEGDLRWAFPPLGISVADYDRVLGRPLARPVEAGSPVRWSDLIGA